jgi:hypothetical protein
VSNLRAFGPLAYTDNERAKQLLYALDYHVWGMKIIALEESVDFATLDTEKLFSKLKSHELSCKGRPNHDASFTSKSLITSTHVGGHDANPTNTISPSLEFALSSLAVSSNEQYESIPSDEIALQGNFGQCTSFGRRGEEAPKTLGAALSVMTPPTSSPTATRGRSMTTPTRTTKTTRTTTKRRITSGTTTRRTSRRSCPKHVQP